METLRACVIGAGASGIVACKALKERGIAFDAFEKGSDIGGLWRFNNDSGRSAAYRSLHINTSKTQTQFDCFPMPEEYPDFPRHSQMLSYFERFVDHFDLRDHIHFGSTVESVRPLPDGSHGLTWTSRDGQRAHGRYDAVVVANGHHWSPRRPQFDGEFHGVSMHSFDYRHCDDLHGKNVLVVGIGNSGCDIACETSRVARQTFLSTRRGAHLIPKYILGKPLDRICPPAVWRYLPRWLFEQFFSLMLKISRGRQERIGVPRPEHGILAEHPTISSDLLNLVGHGRVRIKPNVVELLGNQVKFQDGSKKPIDVIIYATGYDIKWPFLDPSLLSAEDNRVGLYKMVAHPRVNSLYFAGLVQPWGSILPLAERQAEWIAELIDGSSALPDSAKMLKDIANTEWKVKRRYADSTRHTIQVDFFPYLDAIAREQRRGRKRASRQSLAAGARRAAA